MYLNIILLYFIFSYFIFSSILKLINIRYFISLVKEYKVLPNTIAIIFGAVLPFIELSSSFFLLSSSYRIYALSTIGILLVIFGTAVVSAIYRGLIISCGCYGKMLDSKADFTTLFKIVVLILIVFYLLFTTIHLTINFSFLYLMFGFLLTLIALSFQKLINYYKENIKLLRG